MFFETHVLYKIQTLLELKKKIAKLTKLQSVAASFDGLDVLIYHISNTYDMRGKEWKERYKDYSHYMDNLVTAVASSLRLTPSYGRPDKVVQIWHLNIIIGLLFDTEPLNETDTEIVEGIFVRLFGTTDSRLWNTSGIRHQRLVKKMLDYTTGGNEERIESDCQRFPLPTIPDQRLVNDQSVFPVLLRHSKGRRAPFRV